MPEFVGAIDKVHSTLLERLNFFRPHVPCANARQNACKQCHGRNKLGIVLERFLEQRARLRVVCALHAQDAQVVKGLGEPLAIVDLAAKLERLAKVNHRIAQLAALQVQRADVVERERDRALVANLAP